jgi:hypothetical protein
MDVTSYPEWTQEMVYHCDRYKSLVVDHELFTCMKEARLDHAPTRHSCPAAGR